MDSTEPAAGGWHRRLVVQYSATLAAVALGSAVVVGVPFYLLALHLLETELDDRLEGTAEVIALVVAPAPESDRDSLLRALREEAGLDAICVLAPNGDIIAQAVDDPYACRVEPADRAALTSAMNTDSVPAQIHRDAAGEPFLFAFAPLGEAGSATAVVGVRGAAPYLDRLDDLRSLFTAAGGAWILVVLLLGAWSANRLVRPVHRLLAATAMLRSGALPPPPQSGGPLELDALEKAFAEMADSVRERERSLRALAGAVAHEVRNPAHAIRLHLGLLRRHLVVSDDRVRERLDVLDGELDLLEATVEAFLVFARDQAVQRVEVGLREVLERWADGASVVAPDVLVHVDPQLVGRAVANLVRNAREAGGDPIIRAHVNDAIVIEVEDHGRGFPQALVSTAFEPFVSGRAGGSGLGLAIVAAIARAHGGDTWLQAGDGRTVVRFTLAAR